MRLDRRQFTQLTISLAALAAMPGAALGLGVKPRQRVIIDNDFSGDPDGLFQLAHHLASASTLIPFIVGSHIHVNDFLDPATARRTMRSTSRGAHGKRRCEAHVRGHVREVLASG